MLVQILGAKMLRLGVMGLVSLLAGCGVQLEDQKSPQQLNLSESSGFMVLAPSFLTNYQSCEQIKEDLRNRVEKELQEDMARWPEEAPHYFPSPGGCIGGPELAAPVSAAPISDAAKVAGRGQEGIDFSGTNNQEKGVDEADIIKLDGQFFYVLAKNGEKQKLEILSIEEKGELKAVSELILENGAESILLLDDKLAIFSHAPQDYASWNYSYQQIFRLDIVALSADRKEIAIENSYYFKGSLSGARKIGDKIHFASFIYGQHLGLNLWPDLPENYYGSTPEEQDRMWVDAKEEARRKNEEILANYDFLNILQFKVERNGLNYSELPVTEEDCQRSYGNIDDPSRSFLSLFTFDPNNNSILSQSVRGNMPTVYASPDQFILASTDYSWSADRTKTETVIHRFKFDVDNVPSYADSVAVPGHLHNSFSLSEYNGYVRVATTIRRNWQDEASVDKNALYILGEENGFFGVVSALEDIAPGETIWSARFTKDKGFLVTFKQVDPLFTLDLSDPKNPQVVGELKIPGVSTYLQDIGNGQLLSVGYAGNEEGLNWKTSIALFDVSDFKAPRLSSSLLLEDLITNDENSWGWGWSEANYNHLAINYFAPVGLTAIPISGYRWIRDNDCIPGADEDNSDNDTDEAIGIIIPPSNGHYEYSSKLKVVRTKAAEELQLLGEIDHSQFYQANEDSYRDPQVHRSYFVGEYLYAFSSEGITATRLSDMVTTSSYDIE